MWALEGRKIIRCLKQAIMPSLGEDVISEFEQKREQQAKDERDRRFNQKISIAQVLVPLVTFILGLVVEHYSGLVSALSEFLGRWIK